jgi:A/G-specific adenine glycosylase
VSHEKIAERPEVRRRREVAPDSVPDDTAVEIVTALLTWWEVNQRTYPWRYWSDPYRLLVTEVLLRQTRAPTVSAFVDEFFRDYPDPGSLLQAGETRLASRLHPLGFSLQRSAQLVSLARHLVDREQPSWDYSELLDLPGIGRYSAGIVGAVLGLPTAAVDTNVARVLCRIFALTPSRLEARKSPNVWRSAENLIAVSDEAAPVTWALIDLAATLCVTPVPRCSECPLRASCAQAQSWLDIWRTDAGAKGT